MSKVRKHEAIALRHAASRLITGRTWDDDAAEFGALDESSLSDDQLRALEVVDAVATIFDGGRMPTDAESQLLLRLTKELVPLGFRTRDGAAARALSRIDDVADRLRETGPSRGTARLLRELLDYLDSCGYPVAQHWAPRLSELEKRLVRVRPVAGNYKPGAAGLLADLLIAADAKRWPLAQRKHLSDALRKASKRGLKAM